MHRIIGKNFLFIIIIITSLFYTKEIKAQVLQKPLITDRPDQTESAETILPGYFQIETGVLFNKTNFRLMGVNYVVKSYDFAGTLVRIGLNSKTELRIGSSILYRKTKVLNKSEITTGLSGLSIGTKFRLLQDSNSYPNISAIINFNLPVGNNSFRPQNIEPEIVLISAKELSDILTLSVNVGSGWNSTDDNLNYFYSLSLGISLTGKLSSFIEYYGNSSSNISAVNKMDTGFTYLITNNMQYDISGGLDLKTGTSDWFISSGFSFRLPN